MKNTKIALATASALLITTAFSNAQTTIGGNMRVGLKSTSADLGAGLGSNSRMVKETQINIANKGKLNIGGLEYAAGFSIEFDGNDLNRAAGSSTAVCTATDTEEAAACTTGSVVNGSAVSFGKAHYENNYIDIINPSTKTTLSFSADHLKPSDVQLSDIVGGPSRVDHVLNHAAASAAGASIASKFTDKMDDKGSTEGFGIGLIQDLGVGKFSIIYQPDVSENFSALGDTGGAMNDALSSTSNSIIDMSFRGDLGVKGLDVVITRNKQEGTGTDRDIKFHSEGVRYNMGPITAAYQQSKGDYDTAANKTAKSKEYGLAYTVTPTLSVGAVMIKTKDNSAVGIDEKITGLTVGYNLGPVFLSTVAGKIDDAGNTAGADGKAVQITLGTTF
jgi:hypothetical protein